MVHAELIDVQNDMMALMDIATNYVDRGSAVRYFRGFHAAISTRPLQVDSFSFIQNVWGGLDSLIADESQNIFKIKKQRASRMMTNYLAWNWLEVDIPQAILSLNTEDPVIAREWLHDLVHGVRGALGTPATAATFSPLDYGVHLEDMEAVVVDLGVYDHVPDEQARVVSMVKDILAA